MPPLSLLQALQASAYCSALDHPDQAKLAQHRASPDGTVTQQVLD